MSYPEHMTPEDLMSMSDEELSMARAAVMAEGERRDRLALIPLQVADLRARYVEDGGDPADLIPVD